jgi:hypothetical protein
VKLAQNISFLAIKKKQGILQQNIPKNTTAIPNFA